MHFLLYPFWTKLFYVSLLTVCLFACSEFMRSLISNMDFRSLEVRLFKAKVNLPRHVCALDFVHTKCTRCIQLTLPSVRSTVTDFLSAFLFLWLCKYNYNKQEDSARSESKACCVQLAIVKRGPRPSCIEMRGASPKNKKGAFRFS